MMEGESDLGFYSASQGIAKRSPVPVASPRLIKGAIKDNLHLRTSGNTSSDLRIGMSAQASGSIITLQLDAIKT